MEASQHGNPDIVEVLPDRFLLLKRFEAILPIQFRPVDLHSNQRGDEYRQSQQQKHIYEFLGGLGQDPHYNFHVLKRPNIMIAI